MIGFLLESIVYKTYKVLSQQFVAVCHLHAYTSHITNVKQFRGSQNNCFKKYSTACRSREHKKKQERYLMMAHKVFVYGTLKRNEPNYHWLTNQDNGISCFIGDGTTVKKYPLIIATIYNIPFLLDSPGKGYYVKGDVYEVDDNMLSQLDVLEGHPDFYVREKTDISLLNASTKKQEVIKCWVYFLKDFKPDLLNFPMMESYSSKGNHGMPYLERSKRSPDTDHFDFKDLKK